jgi:hypothetical protein
LRDKLEPLLSLVVLMLAVFTATWIGLWFFNIIKAEQEENVTLLWEGEAGWFGVNNIELENDLLKKKLDDLQAHYDSMFCYRPIKGERQ